MKISIITGIIILSCFFIRFAHADDAAFRLVVSRNDGSAGGEFHMDLQMKIMAGSSPRTLNSITADVYYTSELNEWGDAFPGTNWAFGSSLGYGRSVEKLAGGHYRILVTANSVGIDGPGEPPGWNVTDSWQSIVTLRWIINAPSAVNIYIADDTDMAAYFNNLQNNPQGDVTNWNVVNSDPGDISLPVQLSALTAASAYNQIELKWATESEVNNVGFEIYRADKEEGDYSLLSGYQTNDKLRGHGNSTVRHDYTYKDEWVAAGQTYWYKLADVSLTGEKAFHGPVCAAVALTEASLSSISHEIPSDFNLYPNYPNPFNPETILRFDIPKLKTGPVQVYLNIYNGLGQMVKTLYQGKLSSGSFEIQWNGKTDTGNNLSSGVYYAVLQTDLYSHTVKLILLK